MLLAAAEMMLLLGHWGGLKTTRRWTSRTQVRGVTGKEEEYYSYRSHLRAATSLPAISQHLSSRHYFLNTFLAFRTTRLPAIIAPRSFFN